MQTKQRRALIFYATMTGNTRKIATWFEETFLAYNWEVKSIRVSAKTDWAALQDDIYFDDYDVICLGSPIVAGAPLQSIIKTFSLGGGGNLEQTIQNKIDSGATSGQEAAAPVVAKFRRTDPPYSGVLRREDNHPLGIVFCTYGGGFYGTGECLPVLETLRLYLRCASVDVCGRFACAGKETGPAGYAPGVKPKGEFVPGRDLSELPDADVPDPVKYTMADGSEHWGSYFFHHNGAEKPGPRDEAKARAFIADFIEDYFMTYDGVRAPAISEIVSLS